MPKLNQTCTNRQDRLDRGKKGGKHREHEGKEGGIAYPDSTPTSMRASWRSARFIRMSLMEILDEPRVHNEGARDPGPLLRAVTLPVHQILESSPMAVNIYWLTDREDLTIIQNPGGWRGLGRAQWTRINRFQLGDVGHWVNSHWTR